MGKVSEGGAAAPAGGKEPVQRVELGEAFGGGEYPLPSYAVGVWLSGAGLSVTLPPDKGHSKGHTITIPLAKLAVPDGAASRGWAVVMDILKSREQTRGEGSPIGTRASPVQYDVEAMLVAMQGASVKPVRYESSGKPEAVFEELFPDDGNESESDDFDYPDAEDEA